MNGRPATAFSSFWKNDVAVSCLFQAILVVFCCTKLNTLLTLFRLGNDKSILHPRKEKESVQSQEACPSCYMATPFHTGQVSSPSWGRHNCTWCMISPKNRKKSLGIIYLPLSSCQATFLWWEGPWKRKSCICQNGPIGLNRSSWNHLLMVRWNCLTTCRLPGLATPPRWETKAGASKKIIKMFVVWSWRVTGTLIWKGTNH